MRAEEKELEVEKVPEQSLDKAAEERELEDEIEPEAIAVVVEEIRDEHREVLMGAMRAIFERATIAISQLALPERELSALEYLQAAVSGKEALGRFVFAEDRRTMLEQALAILQPNLAHDVEELVGNVDDLRGQLVDLEDAQEEKFGWEKGDELEEVPETTEKPKPDEDLSLDGPEREVAKPTSTVAEGGPAAERVEQPSTLSKGAAVPDKADAPSTLDGAPIPDKHLMPSTLYEETPTMSARLGRKLAGATTPPTGVPVVAPPKKKVESSPAITIPKDRGSSPTIKPPRRGGGGHRG